MAFPLVEAPRYRQEEEKCSGATTYDSEHPSAEQGSQERGLRLKEGGGDRGGGECGKLAVAAAEDAKKVREELMAI